MLNAILQLQTAEVVSHQRTFKMPDPQTEICQSQTVVPESGDNGVLWLKSFGEPQTRINHDLLIGMIKRIVPSKRLH